MIGVALAFLAPWIIALAGAIGHRPRRPPLPPASGELGTQATGLCAKRTFCPLFLTPNSGVQLRWAHRLESLCSAARSRPFLLETFKHRKMSRRLCALRKSR
jgi:hypothetical protein